MRAVVGNCLLVQRLLKSLCCRRPIGPSWIMYSHVLTGVCCHSPRTMTGPLPTASPAAVFSFVHCFTRPPRRCGLRRRAYVMPLLRCSVFSGDVAPYALHVNYRAMPAATVFNVFYPTRARAVPANADVVQSSSERRIARSQFHTHTHTYRDDVLRPISARYILYILYIVIIDYMYGIYRLY